MNLTLLNENFDILNGIDAYEMFTEIVGRVEIDEDEIINTEFENDIELDLDDEDDLEQEEDNDEEASFDQEDEDDIVDEDEMKDLFSFDVDDNESQDEESHQVLSETNLFTYDSDEIIKEEKEHENMKAKGISISLGIYALSIILFVGFLSTNKGYSISTLDFLSEFT